jgi:hypothetical protein
VTQGIASVSFQNGNPLSVVLVTSNALSSGSFFVLVTTNVTDLNGNRIAANTVRQYIASAAPTPTLTSGPGLQGPVVIEWYTSLRSDGSPKDTVNAWKFKSYNPLPDGQADFETYSNVFGIQPGTFLNWADNYGAKIYSYYLAPTSGVYRFYTRDDDFGEFIMNTNNAPGTDSRLPMDRMIGVGGTTVGTVGPGNVQAGTNTPNFQSVWSICDNNPNTKYLNFFNGGAGAGVNSGYIVTPASGPSVVNGIRFTSAADSPERDPSAFTVEGTSGDPRSGTTLWTLLAAGSTGHEYDQSA